MKNGCLLIEQVVCTRNMDNDMVEAEKGHRMHQLTINFLLLLEENRGPLYDLEI
uniref:Uncharacterized protein n=1 Tax=Rhizophora mucronata TaxID=61149 RepID=A0A2P2NW75_RHIMU